MPKTNDITLAILTFYPKDKIKYGVAEFHTALENCKPKYAVLKDLIFDHKFYPYCEEVHNVIATCQQALVLQRTDIASSYLDINARKPRQEFIDKEKLTEEELKQLEEIALEMHKHLNPESQ